MDEIFNRKSTFTLDRKFIREHPNLAFKLMGHLLIVQADAHFTFDGIKYEGYSFLFDKLEDNGPFVYVKLPHYYLGVKENGEIVCQKEKLFLAKNGHVMTCDFGDGTIDLFPYKFDKVEEGFRYRSKHAADPDDRGRVFHDIQTGEQIVIE